MMHCLEGSELTGLTLFFPVGAKVHHSTVNPQRVNEYRKKVRAEVEEKLDEYVLVCRRQKVTTSPHAVIRQTSGLINNNQRYSKHATLVDCWLIVSLSQVSCQKVVIEMDDAVRGLEQLITLHGVAKLVMGAAADKHYSKYGLHT